MTTGMDDRFFTAGAFREAVGPWAYRIAAIVALAAICAASSGCIVTSAVVAQRRVRVMPMLVGGAPAVGAVIDGAPGGGWTTGEKIAGGIEAAGWVGVAAWLYELNRKADSGSDREAQPTVIQNTVSGNNVYIGRDAHGSVSVRRDEMGE
jgi:hypothetical protein